MKSLLESLNIALFESKIVKSTVKDFFNWYFDEDCDDLVKDGDLAPRCADLLDDVELNVILGGKGELCPFYLFWFYFSNFYFQIIPSLSN